MSHVSREVRSYYLAQECMKSFAKMDGIWWPNEETTKKRFDLHKLITEMTDIDSDLSIPRIDGDSQTQRGSKS